MSEIRAGVILKNILLIRVRDKILNLKTTIVLLSGIFIANLFMKWIKRK